jgi:hypothetical protein
MLTGMIDDSANKNDDVRVSTDAYNKIRVIDFSNMFFGILGILSGLLEHETFYHEKKCGNSEYNFRLKRYILSSISTLSTLLLSKQ